MMKRPFRSFHFSLIALLVFFSACQRGGSEVWDDTCTAGRYMGRGMRTMAGKSTDSRELQTREQFGLATASASAPFIPLDEPDPYASLTLDYETDMGYTASDIDEELLAPISAQRSKTASNEEIAAIFQNIQYAYDSSLIRGEENLRGIKKISSYLQEHPDLHISIEGHCDERGPQAYNLALGTRRANGVRNLICQEGISPQRISTVSYGKERPIAMGHDETSHAQNRRSQFKVYTRG